MFYYRLYFWGAGGISGVEPFQEESDEAAIEIAAARARGLDMELWTENRLVRAFAAEQRTG